MLRILPLATFALLIAGVSASAQSVAEVNATMEALFGQSRPFADAFRAIQQAVASHDAAALSRWIAYPFRVSYDDEELIAERPADFIAEYDEIVTEDVAKAVLEQDYGSLFVNTDGVMFGNGEMWMMLVCEDDACSRSSVKVIAIQSTH